PYAVWRSPLLQLLLGQAGVGEFGVGVGDPGYNALIEGPRAPSEGVERGEPALFGRYVGEPVAARYVSYRPDVGDVGAQRRPDFDPLRGGLDPRGLQVERGERRPPAGRDQDLVHKQFFLLARGSAKLDLLPPGGRGEALRLQAGLHAHALAGEEVAQEI